MKKTKRAVSVLLACLFIILNVCFAAFAAGPGAPPGGSGGPGGGGGGGSASPEYTGATTISESITKSGTSYSSKTGSENALLATGGTSTLSGITVSKTGDASDEDADFYGTNAAVLAYNGAVINISDADITTAAAHANAVFAYGEGTVNLSDSTIKTTGNNSGAVMVTGGGTLVAENVSAETSGNSSAPIRSDRGGGTLTVNGGSYTAGGKGSPAVYSTADITVNNAKLTSTSAEGVVIEGSNSATLNNTTLTDTNTSLNGNSETYKNIFIYQSMSGDASEGTGTFTANDSTITTNKGDTFFVTNTTAVINLSNNHFTNTDESGALLRIQAGKWGNSGSNGGAVTLNASNQALEGDVIADSISTLAMTLADSSTYKGTINADNTAKSITLKLDAGSTLTLTGDSYITSLENESSDNANINLNGYTLYVDGEAITSTAYQANSAQGTTAQNDTAAAQADTEKLGAGTVILIAVVAAAVVIAIVTAVVLITRKQKALAQGKAAGEPLQNHDGEVMQAPAGEPPQDPESGEEQ